ncbi:MAG: restriction endonuclease [Dehalococcoidia bacterium]
MRPILELLLEHGEMTMKDVREELAHRLGITDEQLATRIPSGYTTVWTSRVLWSKTYLSKAGALDNPRRGTIRPNERTRELVARSGPINNRTLMQYPEFQAWVTKSTRVGEDKAEVGTPELTSEIGAADVTPHERLDAAYSELRRDVLDTLLERVKQLHPTDFEKLVLELLQRLGYAGTRGSKNHLGRTGDGGVDGMINEDRLGLDRVYIQAKRRTTDTVGAPEIQGFVGSLVGQRADRGVFITTSTFSAPAVEYVRSIAHRVVLIDGAQLSELMWETNLGLSEQRTYPIKAIDTDYFESSLD